MFRTEKKRKNAKLKFGISTADVLVGTSLEFIDVYIIIIWPRLQTTARERQIN